MQDTIYQPQHDPSSAPLPRWRQPTRELRQVRANTMPHQLFCKQHMYTTNDKLESQSVHDHLHPPPSSAHLYVCLQSYVSCTVNDEVDTADQCGPVSCTQA